MTNSEYATILRTGSSASIWKQIPGHSERKARKEFLKGLAYETMFSLGPAARRLREVFSDGPEGMLLWLNLACYTFDPRLPPGSKHPPFFTWEVQDRSAVELWRAIDGGLSASAAPSKKDDSFQLVWRQVDDAVAKVVDHISFRDIMRRSEKEGAADFNI